MSAPLEVYLYPRLPRSAAVEVVASTRGHSLSELRDAGNLAHPVASPAATGGTPVPIEVLMRVQAELRKTEERYGFPKALSQADQQAVDREWGSQLLAEMGIVPADAADEGVWSFMSLVLVPEFAPWRFPGRSEERLIGKPRNAMRRLWWRAWTLGPDLRYAPEGCSPLREDEFVQIMERTTVAGNRRTARAFQEVIWRAEKSAVELGRSDVVRDLMPKLRASRSYLCLDALSDRQLDELLVELLDEILISKGLSPMTER